MPIPSPRKGEKEGDFIGRCMGDGIMKTDYKDQKQRLAVCYGSWREVHGGKAPPAKSEAEAIKLPARCPRCHGTGFVGLP